MAAPLASQVAALTRKNLRRVHRNLPRTAMLAFSCAALLGIVVVLYFFSGYRTLAKGKPYGGLNAFFRCRLRRFNSSEPDVVCMPDTGENREFSVALYDVVRHHDSDGLQEEDALALVSDMLLSGMPVLGFDDYLTISDTFNTILGKRAKEAILKHRFYGPALAPMLKPRRMQIILCCSDEAQEFLDFVAENTRAFPALNIRRVDSLEAAMEDCCDSTWAIMELVHEEPPPDSDKATQELFANVTHARIHLHPYALPDIETTVLRFKDRVSATLTGPVLYQTSGFLTLQYELHKYLEYKSGGRRTFEPVFRPPKHHDARTASDSETASSGHVDFHNSTVITREDVQRVLDQLPSITNASSVPYFTAAFPQQLRRVNQFWQNFSETVAVALVLLMCIPAVLVVGLYQSEKDLGVIEVLQTTGVSHVTSVVAWWCCGSVLVTVFALAGGVAFSTILQLTPSHLLTGLLLLLGFAMLSTGFVISFACPRAEYATFGVPVLAFVLMLPGMLFYELAGSRQRLMVTELGLAMLPPSGFTLAFLTICDLEEQSIAASWGTTLEASHTPLWAFALVLLVDMWVYALFAWLLTEVIQLSSARLFRNCAVGMSRVDIDPERGILLRDVATRAAARTAHLLVMRLQHLHKTFYMKGLEYPVLNGVSVDLFQDDVTCLLGSNGAGKTTLMKILAGVDLRFGGDLMVMEAQEGRRQIGYCPQVDALFDELTVQEHLDLLFTLTGYTSDHDLLAEVALQDDARKFATQLSGGMKRRLSMAMALVGDPLVLILDEPTSGVDTLTRRVLWRVILSRRQGRGVLLSSHHTDDVEAVCDRLWFVSDGKMLYNGTYADLSRRTQTTGFQICLPSPPTAALGAVPAGAAGRKLSQALFEGQKPLRALLQQCQSVAFQHRIATSDLRLRSVTAHAAIVRMYELLSADDFSPAPFRSMPTYGATGFEQLLQSPPTNVGDAEPAPQQTQPKYAVVRSVYMIQHLLAMRIKELSRTGWLFLGTFVVLPALVAWLISATSATPATQSLTLSFDSMGDSEVLSCPDLFSVTSPHSEHAAALYDIPERDVTACRYPSSGALLQSMFADYYNHDRPRWGAFVFDDHIRDFLSSSAAISVDTDEDMNEEEAQRIEEIIASMNKSVTLTSNVTILTNVTAPHALPVFFAAVNNLFTEPFKYTVESNPFPVPTCTEICLERGYKAATLVLVLFFIIPIVSIRVPLYLVNEGAKLQLHLAGVSPIEYWVTHTLLDSAAVFVCTYVTYLAALAGGDPVRSFLSPFGESEDGTSGDRGIGEYAGVLLLCAFSVAAVVSSFTVCLIPVDPVAMQLTLLVAAIVNGLFLHYFFSLQSGSWASFFEVIDSVWFAVSPSYVLGDAFFSMFAAHVQQYNEKPVGILGRYGGGFSRVWFDVKTLLVQAAAYFALTIACETAIPWARVKLTEFLERKPWRRCVDRLHADYTPVSHAEIADDSAISAVGLSSSYDRWASVLPFIKPRRTALTDVSLSVRQGSHTALLGINGGGKTTFFRVATGDLLPAAGKLRVLNMNPYVDRWASTFHVGYCPQFGGLLQFFTVEESLTFFAELHKLVHGRSLAESATREVFPEHMRNHVIAALSGGNKRKLSVLQADAGIPAVLLLDEPTTGVDPVASEVIVRYLRRKSHKQAIVYTSHNLDECAQLCQDVILLDHGRVRFQGSFREFLQLQESGFSLLLKFSRPLHPEQLAMLQEAFDNLHADQVDVLSDDRIAFVFVGEGISEFDVLSSVHDTLERAHLDETVERIWIRDLGVEDMIRIAMDSSV